MAQEINSWFQLTTKLRLDNGTSRRFYRLPAKNCFYLKTSFVLSGWDELFRIVIKVTSISISAARPLFESAIKTDLMRLISFN